ncbi:MAG: hypothetical protein WCL29_07370 [Pseudomonadota bacterium]
MFLPRIRALGNGVAGFALLSLFVASAILVRSYDLFSAGSDVGYYLGMVGGILMLALLVYPLKKRVKFLQHIGSTKSYFIFHMLCGVVGPLAIIYHSTFRIGSQIALVAMVSMLLVAGSGIIGRYIYVRIHDGLSKQELKLDDLEGDESNQANNFNRDMHWAPDVIKVLLDFRVMANQPAANPAAGALNFCMLPLVERRVRQQCHKLLIVHLDIRAIARKWGRRTRSLRGLQFDALVANYTTTVVRRSQFTLYKRIFSWWHILHLPFVYLLAISGIYHVVAVHMY